MHSQALPSQKARSGLWVSDSRAGAGCRGPERQGMGAAGAP